LPGAPERPSTRPDRRGQDGENTRISGRFRLMGCAIFKPFDDLLRYRIGEFPETNPEMPEPDPKSRNSNREAATREVGPEQAPYEVTKKHLKKDGQP
jgi:hypothetical protein